MLDSCYEELYGLPKRVALNIINMNSKSNSCTEDKKRTDYFQVFRNDIYMGGKL